MNVWTTFTST